MWLIGACDTTVVPGRVTEVCRFDFISAAVYVGLTAVLTLTTVYLLIKCKRRFVHIEINAFDTESDYLL